MLIPDGGNYFGLKYLALGGTNPAQTYLLAHDSQRLVLSRSDGSLRYSYLRGDSSVVSDYNFFSSPENRVFLISDLAFDSNIHLLGYEFDYNLIEDTYSLVDGSEIAYSVPGLSGTQLSACVFLTRLRLACLSKIK